MDWAWWAPTITVPGEDKPRGVFAERAFPGAIVVNSLGRRFVNELRRTWNLSTPCTAITSTPAASRSHPG